VATRLINIVEIETADVGDPVSVPHFLNIDGRPVVPDLVIPDVGGFTVTADGTNVTATATFAAESETVRVWVAYLHTMDRVFGATTPPPGTPPDGSLTPQPFVTSPGAPFGSSLLVWGNLDIAAAADTRFLTPGGDQTVAVATDTWQFLLPAAGTLNRISVAHNTADGNGELVTYTLMVGGFATGVAVSLATGAISGANNLVTAVTASTAARISIRAVKPNAIGAGTIAPMVTVQYTPN
jgi:hypothetical protein